VIIDAVVPARNEASTVGDVVRAALDCEYLREVIVVDDGSTDDTAEVAAAAGAKVVPRAGARRTRWKTASRPPTPRASSSSTPT
jgi:glycosyltransferase involved in cell wall biosynthesis